MASFQTPLVPNISLQSRWETNEEAARVWSRLYYEAQRPAMAFSMNWLPQESGLFNPEYLLMDWSHCIVDNARLKSDVIGWAYRALELEHEFCLNQLSVEERAKRVGLMPEDASWFRNRRPLRIEMLRPSQAQYFLGRIREWMDARVAYHWLALRVTFYKADPLALRAPICSDVARLRTRFVDWRDIRIKRQQELFEKSVTSHGGRLPSKESEHYGVDFICWMKDHGVKSEAISWEAIDWLCWLQLVAPISKDWDPHQAARAVRKMFLGEKFRRKAAQWWSAPPSLTYELPEENDEWAARVAKAMVPEQFNEFVEDYVSSELANLKSFTNTLTKQLNDYDIPHRRRRGRPRKSVEEVPDAWERGDQVELLKSVGLIASGQQHKGSFDPESALSDLEKDEPHGWLAARHITS